MSPYRMISNGPTLEQLQARLDAIGERYVDDMVAVGKAAVQAYTPRDTGNMVAWLERSGREGKGLKSRGWVGPLDGLDIDVSVRGAGYLKSFVHDYLGDTSFRPYWDSLSSDEKDALQSGRERGLWGGAIIDSMYAPRYMAAVDRGIVPNGATGGFHNKHKGFVARILQVVEKVAKTLNFSLPTNMSGGVRTDYK